MRTIVLNSTNIIPNGKNNTLVYNFPSSVDLTGAEIAISNITMYYSWQNISVELNNNTFSYVWVLGAVPTTFTVVIPDGQYEISDINSFFQFFMIQQGQYLVDDTGDNVYYAEIVVNPTQYAVQINTFAVPTVLPALWTNPAGLVLPVVTFNPSLTFPLAFNEIVGFVAGFTTSINTGGGNTLSYLSTITPQVQPNSALLIAISGIDNKYANPSSIIYSVAPSVGLGQLIIEKPAQFNFNRLLSGTYNQLRMQFVGTSLQPIVLKDPNMTIICVIKDQDDLMGDLGADRSGGVGGLNHQIASRNPAGNSNIGGGGASGSGFSRKRF
jgi:hypothetical protein